MDFDEEDDDDRESSGSSPLLEDFGKMQESGFRGKSHVISLLLLSLVFLGLAFALPLVYNDMGWIWQNGEADEILLISRFAFLGMFMLGCLLTPMILKSLRGRVVPLLIAGCIMAALSVASCFMPFIYTTAAVAAIAAAVLAPCYTAKGVYVTLLAYRYTNAIGSYRPEVVLGLFNGVFNAIALTSPLWRAVFSAAILGPKSHLVEVELNETWECGPFQKDPVNRTLLIPHNTAREEHEIQALLGIQFTVGLSGIVILLLGLRGKQSSAKHRRVPQPSSFNCSGVCDIFKGMMDVNMILLVPVFVFLGVEQAVMYEIFIKEYIGCQLPEVWIIYAIICQAGCAAIFSLPVGWLVRYTGRVKMLMFNFLLTLALLVVLLLWTRIGGKAEQLLIVAVFWGVADSIWQTQINVLVGVHFKTRKESAFASYNLWQVAGVTAMYAQQKFGETTLGLYSAVAVLTISLVCYIPLEVKLKLQDQERRRRHSSESSIMLPDMDHAAWLPSLDPHSHRKRETLSWRLYGTEEGAASAFAGGSG